MRKGHFKKNIEFWDTLYKTSVKCLQGDRLVYILTKNTHSIASYSKLWPLHNSFEELSFCTWLRKRKHKPSKMWFNILLDRKRISYFVNNRNIVITISEYVCFYSISDIKEYISNFTIKGEYQLYKHITISFEIYKNWTL